YRFPIQRRVASRTNPYPHPKEYFRFLNEWVEELAPEPARHPLPDAENLRRPPFRHVERAEEEGDPGEEAGEVAIQAGGFGGVMPGVERRAGDEVAERAEVPGDVGVDEDGVEGEDGNGAGDDARVEAGQDQRRRLQGSRDQLVERVDARGGEPVERLG